MIVILKPNTPQDRLTHLLQWLQGQGYDAKQAGG